MNSGKKNYCPNRNSLVHAGLILEDFPLLVYSSDEEVPVIKQSGYCAMPSLYD